MTDRGHAAVELALGVGVLLLPVALVVTAFGPWSERRVIAEAAAAEAARTTVLELDHAAGGAVVLSAATARGVVPDLIRLGWCGAVPVAVEQAPGACPLLRGTSVEARVEVWAPLMRTPWGDVGGIWVSGTHTEPIDLYRSLG